MLKITIKNTIRGILLSALIIYSLYCAFHLINNPIRPTYKDCGKVISKSYDDVEIKHGHRTELYLNIKFDKSGFKSIECDPTTYFSKNVGDTVCFNLDEKLDSSFHIHQFIGFLFFAVLCISITLCFIYYISPDSWKF